MPFAAGAVPLIMAGVTAATTAAGTALAASQASAEASGQAKAAQYNATIATQAAHTNLEVGAANEANQRLKNAQMEGEQFAAIGQSGIGITSASAQDVMRQTAINNELDALNVRYAGTLAAHQDTLEASNFATQAEIDRQNAQNAMTGGYLGAGSALLNTAVNYAGGKFGPGYGSYQNGQRIPFGPLFS